jgi:hypothetical protein
MGSRAQRQDFCEGGGEPEKKEGGGECEKEENARKKRVVVNARKRVWWGEVLSNFLTMLTCVFFNA